MGPHARRSEPAALLAAFQRRVHQSAGGIKDQPRIDADSHGFLYLVFFADPCCSVQIRGLEELHMTDFEAQVLADLSVLKSQMRDVVGNGQPGRIARLENRVFDHEKSVQRLKGMAGALGAFLTVAHFAIDLLVGRR
jgi:hypothetical protein